MGVIIRGEVCTGATSLPVCGALCNPLVSIFSVPLSTSDDDGKRMVTWGDLPVYACGGTHVRSTGEVGQIVITRVKEKKGELSVQYELKD